MKIFTTLFIAFGLLFLFSCSGSYKELDTILEKSFEGKVETTNEGNNIIIVFEEMNQLKYVSEIELDYFVSRVATKVIVQLGRSNFMGFSKLRVDVAPLQRSYGYPTKVMIKAIEKLPVIAEIQRLMNKEEDDKLLKKFDDIITPQMFEEQILKEWNDLKQWTGKDVTPQYIGFKLMQLPGEEGYFIQIGGKLKNIKGDEALIEFMFADASKKVISITITYL